MSQVNLSLIHNGDRQLWVVESKVWALPVFCDPFKEDCDDEDPDRYWLLQPAVSFTDRQYAAYSKTVAQHACMMDQGRHDYFVRHNDLHAFARKAEGITPSRYVKWGGRNSGNLKIRTKASHDIRDPIKWLLKMWGRTQITDSYQQLAFIWEAIKGEIAAALLAGQEVDIGPAIIIPSPYRKNWVHLAAEALPKDCKDLSKGPKSEPTNELRELLRNSLLAEVNKDGSVAFNLEIIPKRQYLENSSKMESDSLNIFGKPAYARRWAQAVDVQEWRLLDILRHYVVKALKPSGGIRKSSTGLFKGFFPAKISRSGGYRVDLGGKVDVVESYPSGVLADPSGETADVSEKTEGVQQLPTLRFGTKDLRNTRPDD